MRLFVAVNLPEPARLEVLGATAALRQSSLPVRWVEMDAYHLTLKFLGEVPNGALPVVEQALGDVAAACSGFALRLQGAGAFPNLRRPSVFWIGVAPQPALHSLQSAVEAAIAPLGYPTEQRPFSPHLTLGRTRRDAAPAALVRAAELLSRISCDLTIPIETVDLMRSHLSPRGARYERLLAASLRS